MRSYKAARRAARSQQEPVEFDFQWEENEAPEGEPERWVERKEHFQCWGQVSTLVLSELAFNADVDSASPEGMSLIREVFSQAFGDPVEYRRFFRLVTLHGDDEVLMDIMQGLIEDLMGRPTVEPSGSSSTPSETGVVSKVVSLSRGTVEVLPPGAELPVEEPVEPEEQWGASSG